jgi:hypothetical protein
LALATHFIVRAAADFTVFILGARLQTRECNYQTPLLPPPPAPPHNSSHACVYQNRETLLIRLLPKERTHCLARKLQGAININLAFDLTMSIAVQNF